MRARSVVVGVIATLLTAVGGVTLAQPASAAACSGTGCDNKGPQGSGCFADDKTLASTNGGHFKLRYSRACNAMWAYADSEVAPSFWDAVFEIDLDKKDASGHWQHYKTLSATHSVGEGDDWTNALGARTTNFRFRGYYDYRFGSSVDATAWVLGGVH